MLVTMAVACRRVIQEVMQLKAQGMPIPEHLIPAPKKEKAVKKKGDAKKK